MTGFRVRASCPFDELDPEEKYRKVKEKCERGKPYMDLLKSGEREFKRCLDGRAGYLEIENKGYICTDSNEHQSNVN